MYFTPFDFVELSDLNRNLNNLIKILSFKVIPVDGLGLVNGLDDCLMYLNI